jgi:hypothetical protein
MDLQFYEKEKREMAETQLHFIKYAAEEILEYIAMGGKIEEWYQNKLSKVHSDMEGMHSWMEGEKRRTGMVREETEQLDEISMQKLTQYKTAAAKSASEADKAGDIKKGDKRFSGIMKATKKQFAKTTNEEVEQIDELSTEKMLNYRAKAVRELGKSKPEQDTKRKAGIGVSGFKIKQKMKKEEVEHLEEKNVPTSPEKWAQAKAQAKAKFDVYPSAYANGWAAKKYKEMGGGWKSVNEDLRKWFDPNHPEGGWKRVNTKGEVVGDCAREEGEAKPKCMSNEKRASLTKKERASAVRTKRKHDPNPERKGSPINVSNYGKGKISEQKNDVPFSGPYTKQPSTVTDKSGAKHGPSSTVKHLARMAQKKQVEKLKKPVNESLQESRRVEIVREAMKDAKIRDDKKRKDGEVKGNKDAFEPNPILTSQVVKTSS